MSDVTRILSEIEQGDPSAAEQLLSLVSEELRKLAAATLANEKPGQTPQATALLHDGDIRLVDVEKAQHWNSRGHFFGAAAKAMRRILINRSSTRNPCRLGEHDENGDLKQNHDSAISPHDSSCYSNEFRAGANQSVRLCARET